VNHLRRTSNDLLSNWFSLSNTVTEGTVAFDLGASDVDFLAAAYRNFGGPAFPQSATECLVQANAKKCSWDQVGLTLELQWREGGFRNRLCSGGPLLDSDCDGCSDVEELGGNLNLGGQRNIHFWWDFFDVPVPALSQSNPGGTRNQTVTLGDVLAVETYIGTIVTNPFSFNENGVAYGTDVNGNGIGDGQEYDRLPNGEISGPPSGTVTLQDMTVALAQSGDSCLAPPP